MRSLSLFLFLFLSLSAYGSPDPLLDEDSDQDVENVGEKPVSGERNQYVGIYNNAHYTPLIDLVGYAQKTIDIEIYMMTDRAFRKAIRAALRRGVVIRVVKDGDALGETCKYFAEPATGGKPIGKDCADQRKLVKEIQKKGAFVPFQKAILCGQKQGAADPERCFQHGKMIVVDRDIPERNLALLSTGNFNDSNLCVIEDNPHKCNRDYSYVTRDQEVIAGLISVFEDDLKKVRYENKHESLGKKLTVSPFSKAPLIEFIRSAKKSITLQNQYMKDKEVNQALMEVARKGVKVTMMLASDCSFSKPNDRVKATLEPMYRSMEEAGIQLRFFTSKMKQRDRKGYLHAKAIVVDGESAWMGSVNGSTTSMDVNREYGIFFRQPERVAYLSKVMADDFSDGNSETWQEAFECKKDDLPKPAGE